MDNVSPRSRVLSALNHEEADRVPIDLGGWQSGISYETYEPLKELMNFEAETIIDEKVQGLARVDYKILNRFGVDTRYVFSSSEVSGKEEAAVENKLIDAFGIEWAKPESSHYFDIKKSPFAEKTIDEIGKVTWPNAETFLNLNGVEKHIEECVNAQFPVFTCLSGVFEQTTYVRGMQEFFMDIAADTNYFEALMDRVLESFLDIYTKYFEVVGPHLDVVQFWGDLGTQRGPLISPDVYRKYIKPREMELVKLTKKMTSAKVALHTCGAVTDFIPDLIHAGYDILNPVQTTADGMDPVRLKKDFGDDIVFWGSIDTQQVLPFGSVEQVRDEVKQKIDILAPGGGFLLAPCHNIQAQTPPENVKAMFETALEYGVY